MTRVALVVGYLAAVVAANLITAHYGPQASVYTAFGLVAVSFIVRDRLADWWGTKRVAPMAALIVSGAAISYALNQDAARVALASCCAFAAAETVEAVAYHLLRRRPWLERAPASAMWAAGVDSLVFPTVAFGGVLWSVSFGQFTAKLAGAVLWAFVLRKVGPARPAQPEVSTA